jgi:hypothetical protein
VSNSISECGEQSANGCRRLHAAELARVGDGVYMHVMAMIEKELR